MASSNRRDIKKIRSIRELFHGRFTETEVAMLLDLNNNNSQATVTYILETDPQNVRMQYERERLAWEAVNRVRPHCSERLIDKVKSGEISTEGDLYACAACDNDWWRLSPRRKRVSKCFGCGRRFDMVDPDKWWGWAEFHCTPGCGNKFYGWCHMQVASPCYRCNVRTRPTRIIPPKRRDPNRPRRTNFHQHSCDECSPYFTMRGVGTGPTGPTRVLNRRMNIANCKCAHKPTRRALGLPMVIDPSTEHDSSGSTVDTFLPQEDMDRTYMQFDMETIAEHGSSDENDA